MTRLFSPSIFSLSILIGPTQMPKNTQKPNDQHLFTQYSKS